MKDRKIFVNLDKDTLCFLATIMILGGIGVVVNIVAGNVGKQTVKQETGLDLANEKCDSAKMYATKVIDLGSAKQK